VVRIKDRLVVSGKTLPLTIKSFSVLTTRWFLFVTTCLIMFFSFTSAHAQEWKEEKGDHFIVHYMNDAARPKEILRKAEIYYNKIAEDLGYPRYSNFWQWEKRVKIYIHPSKEAFQAATGQPVWSHGMASYLDKSIHSIETNDNFLDAILPHEITHLVFRDFVGFKGEVALWMDEGVAQWEEDDKREAAISAMPDLVARGDTLTTQSLTSIDVRRETDPAKVRLFYMQAISLVDYLIKNYGTSSFTNLCRELRDGKGLEEAMRIAYSNSIRNIEELDDKWRKYVLRSKKSSQ